MILDPPIDPSLVTYVQYGAMHLPRASQPALSLKNSPASTVFEKPASSEAITSSSCCGGSQTVFPLLIQEAHGHSTPRTRDYNGATRHLLHKSSVHGVADDVPLHKFVVCGEPTLRLLPDSNRCGRQEAELASCAESISSLRKKEQLIARQCQIHEREIVLRLAFEMHSWFPFL